MAPTRPATPKEVADYLQRSEKTLANWRCSGIGPPYVKAEGGVLYRWPDVEKWLASQLVSPAVASRTA